MDNMLRVALRCAHDGVCKPVVLGNEEVIEKRVDRLGVSFEGVEIVNPRHDRDTDSESEESMLQPITTPGIYEMIIKEGAFYYGEEVEDADGAIIERAVSQSGDRP